MLRRLPPLLAPLVAAQAALVALAPSAQAKTIAIADDPHDGLKPVLDVSRIDLHNDPRAVRVVVHVNRMAYGDAAVDLRSRDHRLLAGVYVDHNHAGRATHGLYVKGDRHRARCSGLRSRWDHDSRSIAVLVPAGCLHHGHFGALQTRVLIESGSDADYAPSSPHDQGHWSRFAARG